MILSPAVNRYRLILIDLQTFVQILNLQYLLMMTSYSAAVCAVRGCACIYLLGLKHLSHSTGRLAWTAPLVRLVRSLPISSKLSGHILIDKSSFSLGNLIGADRGTTLTGGYYCSAMLFTDKSISSCVLWCRLCVVCLSVETEGESSLVSCEEHVSSVAENPLAVKL
jgi:hypothetical protein